MSLLVATRPNPFVASRTVLEVTPDLTLSEILGLAVPDSRWHEHAHIAVAGEAVARCDWSACRPEAGSTIAITIVPGQGNVLRIALTIAVVAAAAWAGPAAAGALGLVNSAGALTAGGLAVSGAVGAAVSTVGMLAINALVPPQTPGLSKGDRGSPTYSIAGARNAARLRGPVPVVLGRHRMTPPLAAQTVTEIAGEDVYLRMLVCWGYGPIILEDVKIGETAIDTFDGVEIEHDLGTPGQVPSLSLYSADIFQETLGIALTEAAGWVSRTTQAEIDEISIDVTLPRGLIIFGKKTGDKIAHELAIDIEYRLVGAGVWTTEPSLVITAKTRPAPFGAMCASRSPPGSMRYGLRRGQAR